MSTVACFAPASIGNFAAGFDVLGAAVRPLDGSLWGDVVEARTSDHDSLDVRGSFAHTLNIAPDSNLVMKALHAISRRLPEGRPPLALTLDKGLPIESGIGSSAASAVAAVGAVNAVLGEPLDAAELLACAGEAESAASGSVHLDNVAPSLLGGLRLITSGGQAESLPFPGGLVLVLFLPRLSLSTRRARSVLPAEVSLSTTVAHAQNLAGLIHALYQGDRELLGKSLQDLLAEPHRAHLVPGFRSVQEAVMAAGALGCSLSGSGPAVFALSEEADAEPVAAAGRCRIL